MSDTYQLAIAYFLGLGLCAILAQLFHKWGFPLPDRTHRYSTVDGLRGYLALSVVASHFVLWLNWTRGLPLSGELLFSSRLEQNLGKGAVTIFFMITAFLFYPRVTKGFTSVSWGYLFVSRLFRLYPLFIAILLLDLFMLWAISGFTTDFSLLRDTVTKVPGWIFFYRRPDLFGVHGSDAMTLHPTWSLAWEWLFYVALLPVTALIFQLKPRSIPTWIVPTAYLCAGIGIRRFHPTSSAGEVYLTHFAAGMLIWEISKVSYFLSILKSPAAAIISVILITGAAIFGNAPGIPTLIFYVPILASAIAGNSFFGVLSSKSALVMGEASYGIYLVHPTIMTLFCLTIGLPRMTAWPSAAIISLVPIIMAISFAVSALTFIGLERPLIKRGNIIGNRFRKT